MRERFIDQLASIENEEIVLLRRDVEAIKELVFNIKTSEVHQLDRLEQFEDETYRLQRSAEHSALMLLMRQQPVADDLHVLTLSLGMFKHISRIAVQVVESQRLWIGLSDASRQVPLLQKQGELVLEMANILIVALEAKNSELLQNVVDIDDKVDDVFIDVKAKIVQAIQDRTIEANVAVDLILMGKYFEKMGDHLASISRQAIRLIDKIW